MNDVDYVALRRAIAELKTGRVNGDQVLVVLARRSRDLAVELLLGLEAEAADARELAERELSSHAPKRGQTIRS